MAKKYTTDDTTDLKRTDAKEQMKKEKKPDYAGTDQSSAKNGDTGKIPRK